MPGATAARRHVLIVVANGVAVLNELALSFETHGPRELVRRTMTASSFKQSALDAGYDDLLFSSRALRRNESGDLDRLRIERLSSCRQGVERSDAAMAKHAGPLS
jgi:hypothetical protein